LSGSYAFAFICVPGELEIRSAFLAASLAGFLRGPREIIAVVPDPSSLRPTTRAFFDRLGVRTVRADQSPHLAIECLRVSSAGERLVLLDSSQMLLADFSAEPSISIGFSARCPIAPPNVGDESAWRAIFQSCGTHLPATRGFSRYSGQYFPLCFDPGIVAVPAASGFGDQWLACCRSLAQAHPTKSAADIQTIALAVAAVKSGLEIRLLDERFGHPIWLHPMNERDLPLLARYDNPENIARETALLVVLQKLLAEYPELREIADSDPAWQRVIDGAQRLTKNIGAGDPLTPEIIITGIPRSGSSFLCNLLHRRTNCVILNEPPELIDLLQSTKSPMAPANFLRQRRRDVILGIPISNKIEEGQVIQDTSKSQKLETYCPQVTAANFVLGMKETLGLICRLPMLRQVFPNARFVACVRNPQDTIASWKGSFPHLNMAEVVRQPVGSPIDPWLTVRQQQELRAISMIIDPASRRAAWWRYLANLILQSLDRLILVRYEELVASPREVVSRIFGDWPAETETQPIEPSLIRHRRHLLAADDLLAIRSLCAEPARALGYLERESQPGE
jgi:hypothetical protein